MERPNTVLALLATPGGVTYGNEWQDEPQWKEV
jgi:hypothetical protein